MAQVRVPRKGVTQAELAAVLSRRLNGAYQVRPHGAGQVTVRRDALRSVTVRIRHVPGATVFRVRGAGVPVVWMGTARRVTDALRSSPEFRSVLTASGHVPARAEAATQPLAPPGGRGRDVPRIAGRLSAPGRVMVLATLLALAIRLFTLTRPGYLTGITEYDDGVYLGAAVRLTQGALPYKDFAFIQPPGILLLMTPVALIARVSSTVNALALARLLTAAASTACVPLAGNLVRYRGAVVTLVTCGALAVYPDDITTAHTLLLEPWMNLCCLLAADAAFRRGSLASPRRLAWAGLAFGFATAVKFWAAVPAVVLLEACVLVRDRRAARIRAYLPCLAAGFAVPVVPFVASAPGALLRATITDQAARTGSGVPLAVRLAHLTGVIDILNTAGRFSLNAGANSMFAAAASPDVPGASSAGWLPYVAAAILVVVIAGAYAWQSRLLTHLEWFSLVTAILACAAILGYSAFFYHYPDFPAPWAAVTLGGAAGALAGHPAWRTVIVRAIAAVIVCVAALQIREMFPSREPTAGAMAHLIPKGACVVADEVSLPISADRFADMPPGCPVIVDSLAATLTASDGVGVQGGASRNPAVVAQWKTWLGEADYVWLSPGHGSRRRIPWTPALSAWFNAAFEKLGSYSNGTGQLYKRITP